MNLKNKIKWRWEEIFTRLGANPKHFEKTGKGSPCPVCGGHDRFTYYNKDGSGSAYCRGNCGIRGDGFYLVGALLGLDPRSQFGEICKRIEGVL